MKSQTHEKNVAEFWNRESRDWGEKYDVSSSYYYRCQTFYDFFVESAKPNCLVLDYGCGAGNITFPLLQEGHSVVGVDIAAEMINKASNRAKNNGFESKSEYHILNDKNLLHVSDRKYDAVICSSVLEYVPDDKKLLELFSSLLKPSGILIISVPDKKSIFCKLDKWLYKHQGLFRRLIPVEKLAYLDIQMRQYDIRETIKDVMQLGFLFQKKKHNSITKQRGYLMEKISNVPFCGMLCIMKFTKE